MTLRPAKPALGRGRVQRAALRALRLFGTVTTSQIMPWAFPRKVYRGERLANHDYRSARRVLIAVSVQEWIEQYSGDKGPGEDDP